MSTPPRTLLISLRDQQDPVAKQEASCFKSAAGLDELDVLQLTNGTCQATELQAYDLIFIGGSGAYSVLDDTPWIHAFLDLLLEICAMGIPTHASCFGFQGLALALGGSVVHDEARRELGVRALQLTDAGATDPLFSRLPTRFYAQLGHHDHVTQLPSGVTELVTGEMSPHQALKVDNAPFWATQFHPELNRDSTMERWLVYRDHYASDPESGAEIENDIRNSPDTPETSTLLPALVDWVRTGSWDR